METTNISKSDIEILKHKYSNSRFKQIVFNLFAAFSVYYVYTYVFFGYLGLPNSFIVGAEISKTVITLICILSIMIIVQVTWRNLHTKKIVKIPPKHFWGSIVILQFVRFILFTFLLVSVIFVSGDSLFSYFNIINMSIELILTILSFIIWAKVSCTHKQMDNVV